MAKKTEAVSRRGFLVSVGKLAAGAAVGSAALSYAATTEAARPAAMSEARELSILGTPSQKLDLDVVEKAAYDSYKRGLNWGGGSFEGVTLAMGFPYTIVPAAAFKWAEGGSVGWGAHCGTLVGAGAAIGLVYGATPTTTKLVNELNTYYSQTHGQGTLLCHVSVGNWGVTNGQKLGTPEMSERCAKLTGEIARKAAELINSEMDGTVEVKTALSEDNKGCLTCHGTGARQDTLPVKQECAPCHPNQHQQ